jgi:hypothetical protein
MFQLIYQELSSGWQGTKQKLYYIKYNLLQPILIELHSYSYTVSQTAADQVRWQRHHRNDDIRNIPPTENIKQSKTQEPARPEITDLDLHFRLKVQIHYM